MRHRKAGIKLNRTASHRSAMFRNMVTSLLKHESIQTTDAKAKEVRRWADHIITLAKRGDLHARRQALSILQEKDVVYKIFDVAEERFGSLNGGYTRVIKIGRRRGDAAPVSIVELVGPHGDKKNQRAKKKQKRVAEPVAAATVASAPDAADREESSAAAPVSDRPPEESQKPADEPESAQTAVERAPQSGLANDAEEGETDVSESTDELPAIGETTEKPDTEK